MAFPANSLLLSSVLDRISDEMRGIRSDAQNLRTASAAGPVSATSVISYLGRLVDAKDRMAALASAPGLAAYAQQQYNNPSLDIAAEYNATVAQINATRDWIIANFPKTATTNELRERTFDANGRTVAVQFSSASMSGLRAALDALIATIA